MIVFNNFQKTNKTQAELHNRSKEKRRGQLGLLWPTASFVTQEFMGSVNKSSGNNNNSNSVEGFPQLDDLTNFLNEPMPSTELSKEEVMKINERKAKTEKFINKS